MASKEIAAMLDALMGRHRNLEPGAEVREPTWEDEGLCRFHLVQFCPHDLFTNTKADLGACKDAHEHEMKELFLRAPASARKDEYVEEFLRFAQRMLSEVGSKIKRSKERLLLDQREQLAATGVSPEQAEEAEMKIEVLTEQVNGLVDQAEEAGNRGEVEEAQGILRLSDELKQEREGLQQSIGLGSGRTGPDGVFGPPKAMEVCEVCGAFLIVGDAQARVDDHLMGKLHVGYARLRASVDQLLEDRARARASKEAEREKEVAEREAKRLVKEEGREGVRRSHDKERRRSRSRERKSRRSRDRGRRERSRDKVEKRDRSRERRRSREREERGREGGERSRVRCERSREDGRRRSRDRCRD